MHWERHTKVRRLHFKLDILEHLPRMPRAINIHGSLHLPLAFVHAWTPAAHGFEDDECNKSTAIRMGIFYIKVFQLLVNTDSPREEFYRLGKLSSSSRLSEKELSPSLPCAWVNPSAQGVITNPNRKHLTSECPLRLNCTTELVVCFSDLVVNVCWTLRRHLLNYVHRMSIVAADLFIVGAKDTVCSP